MIEDGEVTTIKIKLILKGYTVVDRGEPSHSDEGFKY